MGLETRGRSQTPTPVLLLDWATTVYLQGRKSPGLPVPISLKFVHSFPSFGLLSLSEITYWQHILGTKNYYSFSYLNKWNSLLTRSVSSLTSKASVLHCQPCSNGSVHVILLRKRFLSLPFVIRHSSLPTLSPSPVPCMSPKCWWLLIIPQGHDFSHKSSVMLLPSGIFSALPSTSACSYSWAFSHLLWLKVDFCSLLNISKHIQHLYCCIMSTTD